MFEGELDQVRDVTLRTPFGDEAHVIPLLSGRAPRVIRLPFEADLFGEFTIDSWQGGDPVYVFTGLALHPKAE